MGNLPRFSAIALLSIAALDGCAQARPARAQEVATEHMQHLRFGRNEVAVEAVSDEYRQLYLDRHHTWGETLRVADVDMTGLKITGDDAEVGVKVSWYKDSDGDLHSTLIRQKWHDAKGRWKLVSEERIDGAVGLFGEKPTAPVPADGAPENANAKAKPKQFPTYVLGQQKEE